jgi:hypothetical protein
VRVKSRIESNSHTRCQTSSLGTHVDNKKNVDTVPDYDARRSWLVDNLIKDADLIFVSRGNPFGHEISIIPLTSKHTACTRAWNLSVSFYACNKLVCNHLAVLSRISIFQTTHSSNDRKFSYLLISIEGRFSTDSGISLNACTHIGLLMSPWMEKSCWSTLVGGHPEAFEVIKSVLYLLRRCCSS